MDDQGVSGKFFYFLYVFFSFVKGGGVSQLELYNGLSSEKALGQLSKGWRQGKRLTL